MSSMNNNQVSEEVEDNVFFISDTHFGHRNILKFEPEARPFETTSHMDDVMIANWNSVVGPDDTVIHLGDVVMGDFEAGIEKMKRLNGIKILVPGNHDRVFSGEKESRRERFDPIYREVFDEIWPEVVEYVLSDGTTVMLSHFPYEGDHSEVDRHMDKRPADEGKFLIHGHVHSLWHINGRMFNVGVDVNGLTPVSEETILNWIHRG
jgi:calcineurin-like phosphoesterase family protein